MHHILRVTTTYLYTTTFITIPLRILSTLLSQTHDRISIGIKLALGLSELSSGTRT